MDEIGVLTPEQARLMWQDYLTRQQLVPQISQNFPQRRKIDEPSPHRVFIHNTTEEEIPAFACVEIVGTEIIGDVTLVTVQKPTKTDGEYLFNSQYAIPVEDSEAGDTGNGWAFRFGVVIMLGSPPAGPTQYRPIVDSWEVEEGDGPFVVFGAHNVVEGALIGRFIGGGASGDYVTFEFVDGSSSSGSSGSGSSSDGDGVPDACEDRVPATGPFFGRVVHKACGMGAVPGEDDDGLIELQDDLGILDGRDYRDIVGRIGFAVRMKEDLSGSASASAEGECYWMIVIVNFWRTVQVVTDFIFDGKDFTIKKKNITVWDDCDLPDEVLLGDDCLESSSGSSGGEVEV